ncbi:MAG TPA: type 1 glutamine amidotransferase domain-containing protein [Candidatus Dormibacteraeota bacterium]|nr:type 1 glutamine amidotransferase domain-containing protein [Candidatus Dormibacteraeota bacterium]
MPKVLIIVTSHSEIDPEHKTGLWLEEYSIPRKAFHNAGFDVVTASPIGGQAPLDPRSLEGVQPDPEAVADLARTLTLQETGDASQYDAIFLPGGHGTMFDLAGNQPIKTLLSEFDAQGKIVAAVCHGPAAFVDAIKAAEPHTLVHGRRITCFTDAEERAVKLDALMPFLLESKLREQGANVVTAADWADHVEVDGNWITGQNPQSSGSTAKAVINALQARV